MSPAGAVQCVLLGLLVCLLVLDLRAASKPVSTVTGLIGLCGGQISHCDGCRRAVLVATRPWILLALGVALCGLVAAVLVALVTDAPVGVPGAIASATGAVCALALLGLTLRTGRRAREHTGHPPVV